MEISICKIDWKYKKKRIKSIISKKWPFNPLLTASCKGFLAPDEAEASLCLSHVCREAQQQGVSELMTVFHVFVYSDGRSVLLICCVSAKQWRENTESRFLPKGQSSATSSGADVPAACLAEWKHSECSSTFLPCSFGRRSGLQ